MFKLHPVAGLVFTMVLGKVAFSAEPIVIQPTKAEKVTEVRNVPLASGSTLRVKNVNGHIRVVAWDKDQVEFTGEFKPSSKDEQVKVVIESTSKGLEIRGEYPKHSSHFGFYRGPECQMDLKVPRKVMPSLDTVNGEVRLMGTQGAAEIHSVNGQIIAQNLEDFLKAKTVNGAIALEQVKGGLDLNTVNGSIKGQGLDGQGKGIDASTVNGSISLQMGGIKGRLSASTVNGGLSFKAQGAEQVEIHKRNMSAVFPGSEQRIHLSTVNGGITVE